MTLKKATLFILGLLFPILGILAAPQIKLIPEQSSLSYSTQKYGSITIEGELSSEARKSLSGSVLAKKSQAEGLSLSGEIALTDPSFDSDNVSRDEAIDRIFQTGVRIKPLRLEHSTLYFLLSINGVEREESTDVALKKYEELLNFSGTFEVDRQFYQLIFTEGFAATLDMAISNQFSVYYELTFSGNEEAIKLIEASLGFSSHKKETEDALGLAERMISKLKALLGLP